VARAARNRNRRARSAGPRQNDFDRRWSVSTGPSRALLPLSTRLGLTSGANSHSQQLALHFTCGASHDAGETDTTQKRRSEAETHTHTRRREAEEAHRATAERREQSCVSSDGEGARDDEASAPHTSLMLPSGSYRPVLRNTRSRHAHRTTQCAAPIGSVFGRNYTVCSASRARNEALLVDAAPRSGAPYPPIGEASRAAKTAIRGSQPACVSNWV
jgi:hypothetical protein